MRATLVQAEDFTIYDKAGDDIGSVTRYVPHGQWSAFGNFEGNPLVSRKTGCVTMRRFHLVPLGVWPTKKQALDRVLAWYATARRDDRRKAKKTPATTRRGRG